MAIGTNQIDDMPCINDIKEFDPKSGLLLERLIFNNRFIFITICALITAFLGYQASMTKVTASFEKMIPQNHPYTKNYFNNKKELPGLGNSVRVVVENKNGDIMNPEYLEVLQQVSDSLILTAGADRAWVKSLWTPSVRWSKVTEEGFLGGPVMPPRYDGSLETLAELQANISNAGLMGTLIGLDNKSSMVVVPLLEKDPETGQPVDYKAFSDKLEKIREKAEASGGYNVYIIGFAKLVGDLMDGLVQVIAFFGITIIVASLVIFIYTRCVRSTSVVILCSVVAVIWQLGLLVSLGFTLDPYSILVPFLVFAIGVSHGVQKMNGIMRDIALGTHRIVAARYTFRRLFMAGFTAIITDAVGFSVMMLIDIPVIKELAMLACIGVAVIIFTNLLMIPLVLSFTGVSTKAAERRLQVRSDENSHWSRISEKLSRLTEPRWAMIGLGTAVLLAVIGFVGSQGLQVGDLDPGAPELRPNSRYNQDNAYITDHYSLSSDMFAIIAKTAERGGLDYAAQVDIDRLEWELKQLSSVQTVSSVVDLVKMINSGACEGSPKWYTIPSHERSLHWAVTYTVNNNPDMCNLDISVMPIVAYLKDHKAATLQKVVQTCENFAEVHNTADRQFLLAAGSAGVEAATNIVVEKANTAMLFYVYSAIILLSLIAFRTWRAVLVAVVPLSITSLLCETLMVALGIGVKVATLPVIALGVGIGVDYALYLVSIQLGYQRNGMPLKEAYRKALRFTGKVVALVGVTFSLGVITWAFSPIKFQADMGLLLTFMFFWNMIGALVLTPVFSHFVMRTRWIVKKGASENSNPEKTCTNTTNSFLSEVN